MPATKAVNERSFSSRSTTANNRLNDLLILHIHKLLTHRLDLKKVAHDFLIQNLDFDGVRHYVS